MKVDIYVRDKRGNREIRIPLLPEKYSIDGGNTTFVTSDIMSLGEVYTPSGTELRSYSWQSELPGEFRKNDPMIRGVWQPPKYYYDILNEWQKNGTKLTLLIVGSPINTDVYLSEFHAGGAGPFGDLSYEIKFVEARNIVVTSTKVATEAVKRPTSTSQTYTIKSGDTLWGIAVKSYGSGAKWKTIYDANKEIIEKTAKKYGKKSSDNGHWIYPGVTLTIPNASASSASSSTSTSTSASTSTTTTDNTKKRWKCTNALCGAVAITNSHPRCPICDSYTLLIT